MVDFVILGMAAFFAGFVDSIVGGGGLVQIPALFSMLPGTAPATLLGTNKLAGIWGTAVAARNYMRKSAVRWGLLAPAALMAFLFSGGGAYLVSQVSAADLKKALPLILIAVAVYTFKKKDFGSQDKPVYSGRKEVLLAMLVAALIGFYDGFFGPGTGSFFMFLFVRVFGYDFLRASTVAKVLNVATNASALVWFGYSGHVIWLLGGWMALCQIGGSLWGSQLAIRNGSGFVRKVFLVVVVILICKTTYDGFLR